MMSSLTQDTQLSSRPELGTAISQASKVSASLQHRIRCLNEKRSKALVRLNQLSAPISKLPVELFIEIFRHIGPPSCFDEACNLEWINFTQVCKSWRAIALDDSRLWTFPYFGCLSLAEKMVRRARGRPVCVDLGPWPLRLTEKQESVLARIIRNCHVQMLKGHMINGEYSKMLRYLPDTSLFLKLINISIVSDEDVPGDMRVNTRIIAPRLEVLRLQNAAWPLQPQALSHLTHITICNDHMKCCINPSSLLTLKALTALLTSAPQLEEVSLTYSLMPSSCSQPDCFKERLVLPRMRILSIHDFANVIYPIMWQLEMPNLQDLRLFCESSVSVSEEEPLDYSFRGMSVDEWASILYETGRTLAHSSFPQPSSLSIQPKPYHESFYELKLELCNVTRPGAPCSLNATMRAIISLEQQPRYLEKIANLLPVRRISTLWLNGNEGTTVRGLDYWKLYTSLPSLRDICFRTEESIWWFISAMDQILNQPDDWRNNIQKLALSRVGCFTFYMVSIPEASRAHFVTVMAHRQQLGIQVPTLLTFVHEKAKVIDTELVQSLQQLPDIRIRAFSLG